VQVEFYQTIMLYVSCLVQGPIHMYNKFLKRCKLLVDSSDFNFKFTR
jgi:hypothetical protein